MATEQKTIVNVHEAKTHFSKLLARVEAGECIVIARGGKPVAELGPIKAVRSDRRPLGIDKGLVLVGPDWDDPIPGFTEYFEDPD